MEVSIMPNYIEVYLDISVYYVQKISIDFQNIINAHTSDFIFCVKHFIAATTV